MIVNDFNVVAVPGAPAKANAPLIVDADAKLTGARLSAIPIDCPAAPLTPGV
jgi:hypothetical protein